jgi:hypothetical protein
MSSHEDDQRRSTPYQASAHVRPSVALQFIPNAGATYRKPELGQKKCFITLGYLI